MAKTVYKGHVRIRTGIQSRDFLFKILILAKKSCLVQMHIYAQFMVLQKLHQCAYALGVFSYCSRTSDGHKKREKGPLDTINS